MLYLELHHICKNSAITATPQISYKFKKRNCQYLRLPPMSICFKISVVIYICVIIVLIIQSHSRPSISFPQILIGACTAYGKPGLFGVSL